MGLFAANLRIPMYYNNIPAARYAKTQIPITNNNPVRTLSFRPHLPLITYTLTHNTTTKMSSFALPILLILLLTQLTTSQDTSITPTTLHFFPRTSCNTGTSLFFTTVADLYADTTCHTTPVGTEALYVDGVAGGCAGKFFLEKFCPLRSTLA